MCVCRTQKKNENHHLRIHCAGRMSASLTATSLSNASSEATTRFREAAKLAQERLAKVRDPSTLDSVAAGGLPAQEILSSISWVAAMLLTTAEEALRAKHAWVLTNERLAADQIERVQHSLSTAQQAADDAAAERDSLRKERPHWGPKCVRRG